MKILAIRGKNLASLEGEFEIDFTKEPLQSTGIFAITGNTGAGKSTILDALCLALFDDAPRFNKAEIIKREDLESLADKISPQDSRNILRRGTSEGFAEVDFIALNGDKYRSSWSVRRARGKTDGTLQSTIIKLDNLTTTTEEQGTKTELIIKITELIGLKFDQFTRAVLLAQGDFATFLKSKQTEKAELLEKLTGTEIYSKISAKIFEKKREAEKNLDLIKQRIKDIKLLTDEELKQLTLDKANLDKEVDPLKKSLPILEKKLAWIKQFNTLSEEISEADTTLKKTQVTIKDAKSRYEYMAMIDLSQEIRDSYIDLRNKQEQLEAIQVNLFTKENELKTADTKLDQVLKNLSVAKTTLDNHEQKYLTLKPDIENAKDLDTKIVATRQKIAEIQNEFDLYKKQEELAKQSADLLTKQNDEAKLLSVRLTEWFEDNKRYKDIVLKVDLIVSLLNNAQTAKEQKENVDMSLISSRTILKANEEKLTLQEKEAERLNQLLPTEILNLREQLAEGKPCLVCGSIHHPLQDIINQTEDVNEKELKLAKKAIAQSILEIKEIIEKTKKGITEFETHSNSFQTQYDKSIDEVKAFLESTILHWQEQFESKRLQSHLQNIAKSWNENTNKLNANIQRLETSVVKLESENKSLQNIKSELKRRNESLKSNNQTLKEQIEARALLLDNKSVNEVEKQYTNLKAEYTKSYESIRFQKDKLETDKAKVDGIISQLKGDNKSTIELIEKLDREVLGWVNSNKHSISLEQLKDLMAKSREWINEEKTYLSKLKEQELVWTTTLKERNERLEKHEVSEDKPKEEQNKETLSQEFEETSIKIEEMGKCLTEILVSLKTHEAAKTQIKSFEKELQAKEELYTNWAKLDDLLGSATGNKFKTIAQGYTLDVLLGYANKHLEELTRRYRLEKITDTLALQVVDNDTLGEVRSVHTLSGGESFLISLSLALGLSSLSSNRMKIESLFIDEGFGSLDIDTLSIAMDALENLQTQGRKIGVISHVAEMTERITTQVQVVKLANGRSRVEVVG
ncbi:AAA family ATPase [Dysgonomonas sp. HDW5B]|uniref:AAA family ATPase n=1 Tax=Dysgonomonas sp. HDW5B TaxID=2714927 RepID=UPI00140A54EB|nr:AAA family ATPase [Dysgonomonas sp. HDW5B]QIK54461.1 AAA family ATPase [Dysgonomonas sp. HDW5B]